MSQKSADLIKKLIWDKRLTITEFSRISGLSRTTIYNYLKGQNIHPKAAKKIESGIKQVYGEIEMIHWKKLVE